MKLLSGKPIEVDGIYIKPYTLGEIADMGYSEFQGNINMLLLTLDDMIESIDDFEVSAMLKANKHQYKVFDLYVASTGMVDILISSLSMVLRTDDIQVIGENVEDMRLVVDGTHFIDRDNYDEVVKIIEVQNNPNLTSEDEDYNPANDIARSIAEKIQKGKDRARKSKAMESGGEGITLADMISAVSAMSNSINKLNIWDLTVYQLYDEFARLSKIDNYKFQVQASMWSSEVEIEHWSEPL